MCLRSWNKTTYGNIFSAVQTSEDAVSALEAKYEDSRDEWDRMKLSEAKAEYTRNVNREELYWEQLAGIKWVAEGDRPTGFFHSYAKKRRRKNHIHGVCVEGEWVDSQEDIANTAVEHFKGRFGMREGTRQGDFDPVAAAFGGPRSAAVQGLLSAQNSSRSSEIPAPVDELSAARGQEDEVQEGGSAQGQESGISTAANLSRILRNAPTANRGTSVPGFRQELIPKVITGEHNRGLIAIPGTEEIRATVFSMDARSVAGSDGFNGKFFQEFWSVIESDLCEAVVEIFSGAPLPKGVKATVISLIP